MEFDKIVKLIQTVSDSNLTQFTLEEGNLKISLKTDKQKKIIPVPAMAQTEQKTEEVFKAADLSQVSASEAPKTGEEELSGNVIKSPLVGTFYNSPSPDSDSFVKTGDMVKKGQVLGIIEAMKLMNEIESEYDGVVERILVDNEQVVEYGQPLFVIRVVSSNL